MTFHWFGGLFFFFFFLMFIYLFVSFAKMKVAWAAQKSYGWGFLFRWMNRQWTLRTLLARWRPGHTKCILRRVSQCGFFLHLHFNCRAFALPHCGVGPVLRDANFFFFFCFFCLNAPRSVWPGLKNWHLPLYPSVLFLSLVFQTLENFHFACAYFLVAFFCLILLLFIFFIFFFQILFWKHLFRSIFATFCISFSCAEQNTNDVHFSNVED